MNLLSPGSCAIDNTTPIWLLLGVAGLLAVVIASLTEVGAQWRRASRTGATLSTWLPFAPPLLWSLVCGLLAGVAIGWYRDITMVHPSPPGAFRPAGGFLGECIAIAQTGIEIEFAVGVGIVLLAVGGLALRLTRRRA